MANKRELKHTINLICEDLFAECVAASLYGNNRENSETLIFSLVRMQQDYISRISHPEPGMPAKRYFKKLRESFVAQVSEVVDHINHIS